MANIQCTNNETKSRLQKKSPDSAIANAGATIIGHQGTDVGPIQHSFISFHVDETQNQAQEKSCDRAMANASATNIGHQGTDVGPI